MSSKNAPWAQVRLWAPVIVYMAAIGFVSAQSHPPMPAGMSDIVGHTLAYAGLAVLVVRALAGGLPARITLGNALGALLITAAYGASDEVHQMFVGGRTAELRDLYADGTGALLGIVACWAWGILWFRSDV